MVACDRFRRTCKRITYRSVGKGRVYWHYCDPAAIAKKVEASVFTIETPGALGSGFVISSDGTSSTLVTNFHVVEDVVSRGGTTVTVRHNGEQLTGVDVIPDVDGDRLQVAGDFGMNVDFLVGPELSRDGEGLRQIATANLGHGDDRDAGAGR